MPRIVNRHFPPEFFAARDHLLAVVKGGLRREPDLFTAAARDLARDYSDSRWRQHSREQERRDAARAGRSGSPAGRARVPADKRRALRLEWAFAQAHADASGERRSLALDHLEGHRRANAIYLVLVACVVLDPEADSWLSDVTDLALCPWQTAAKRRRDAPRAKQLPARLRGYECRQEVFRDWGHEAFRLLRSACDVLGWLPPATTDSHAPNRGLNMRVIAVDGPLGQTDEPVSARIRKLASAFDQFYVTMDATTVPVEGGRKVLGPAHAIALSEATVRLFQELSDTTGLLLRTYGKQVDPGVVTVRAAASPQGPSVPLPSQSFRVWQMSVGGDGAQASLVAALQSAVAVAGYPTDRWNSAQGSKPGGSHQRWLAGDVVTTEQLHVLEAAAKLLRLPQASDNPDPPDNLEYQPATWFKKGASVWLRKAAAPGRKSKRVRSRTDDDTKVYCVDDVRRWRPKLLPDPQAP